MARITAGGSVIEGEGRICDIMASAGLHVDAYLYIMEGVPVPSDTVISGDETVDAIRVASGG